MGNVLHIIDFLTRRFANRLLKGAFVNDGRIVLIFDPPNFGPVNPRDAGYIRQVEIGGRLYKVARVDRESSGVASHKAVEPGVMGRTILVLMLDETREQPGGIFRSMGAVQIGRASCRGRV